MKSTEAEVLLSRILAFGSAFTAIFLISSSVTDPVNAPKLLILGITSSAALGVVLFSELKTRIKRVPLALGLLFLGAIISASLFSESPLSQNLYGSYGRNNGLLTYLSLVVLLLCTTVLIERESFRLIFKALFFAGVVNVAYCSWVLLFGDFIGWYNPSGKILGTFGNQNFVSSFLGIFFGICFAYLISHEISRVNRIVIPLLLIITFSEIVSTKSIQGLVVTGLCVAVALFSYVRSKFSIIIQIVYSISALLLGALAVLGTLQIGPLQDYLYKTSVSLRGQYWLAGWNTGQINPSAGVGMDAFGDWYRRARDHHALELPGVNTVVNTAHNVFMDMFAFGGFPLLFAYGCIFLLSLVSVIKIVKFHKKYDYIAISLVTAWIGYQAQSIISINQIGLATWGWLLSGAVIAFENHLRLSSKSEVSLVKRDAKKSSASVQSTLAAAGFALIGLILVLPPLTADTKWRSAQLTRSLPATESSMKYSYFNPQNSTKYLINIQTLESSNLFDLSHRYALEAVAWNPEAFELWKVLYLIKNSTSEEKFLALKNMNRLDPLNPDVTATR